MFRLSCLKFISINMILHYNNSYNKFYYFIKIFIHIEIDIFEKKMTKIKIVDFKNFMTL